MCGACYKDMTKGKPVARTPLMEKTAQLLAEVYETGWGASGGPLHVYSDDMNLYDDDFDSEAVAEFTKGLNKNYEFLGPTERGNCATIFANLASMTEPQRAEVCYTMLAEEQKIKKWKSEEVGK